MTDKLTGPIAATHTPFDLDGNLKLGVVEKLAEYLHGRGISAVFIAGTTGECHSLTLAERRARLMPGQWPPLDRPLRSSCTSGQIAWKMPETRNALGELGFLGWL